MSNRGWEPAMDLAVRECHGCGRDGPVATFGAIPPKPYPLDVDFCLECLLAAVELINEAYGMQHHAMFVSRDAWWAKGGHCLCGDCAPPRTTSDDRLNWEAGMRRGEQP